MAALMKLIAVKIRNYQTRIQGFIGGRSSLRLQAIDMLARL
jgi:hypothetical protein